MAYTTIDDPSAFFKCQLYTGNGSANHAITFDDTDTVMQPDVVWIKNRDQADAHLVFDSVRGATKYWKTNANESETTDADTLDSFTSNGFQVDADVKVNTNTEKYVAWCWKESADAGFDMVSYVGNHTSGRTVAHSLSAVPEFFIIKNMNSAEKPAVYHKGVDTASPEDYLMVLSEDAARLDDLSFLNDTAPTSSVVTLGNTQGVSEIGSTMILYAWTGKQGFSKFGSYVGNSSSDGSYIHLGFSPALIMVKCTTDASTDWLIADNQRSYNKNSSYNNWMIRPNTSAAEENGTVGCDFLSNGFKWRDSENSANVTGRTYIYMAFAHSPFVNSNGVPNNAVATTGGR